MSAPYIRDFTLIENGLQRSLRPQLFLVFRRLLREDRNARVCCGCIQVVLSLAVDFFAGSIASSAHGSRSGVLRDWNQCSKNGLVMLIDIERCAGGIASGSVTCRYLTAKAYIHRDK
ncbi:hypothetical protein E8E15_000148 [Penicillium rubens]|jgi:hypothetical protein|nr:hypothetical protein E8E15_000148 [Penicillium rubens]